MGGSSLRIASATRSGGAGAEASSETIRVSIIQSFLYNTLKPANTSRSMPVSGMVLDPRSRYVVKPPDLPRGQGRLCARHASPAVGLSGVGDEQALPEAGLPELPDQRLGLGCDQEVGQRLAPRRV